MYGAIITGGTGFFGKYLVGYLLNNNYKVVSISRSRSAFSHENLLHIIADVNHFDFENLVRQSSILKLFKKCSKTVIFHLAWSGKDKLSDLDVKSQMLNINGLDNLLKLGETLRVNTFVLAGTMEEGFAKKYQSYSLNSESAYYNRHIVYASVKLMAREYLYLNAKKYNMEIKVFANSHLMGIGDDKDSFLQCLIEKMILRPKETILTSSGNQLFDVIGIEDAARAYEYLWHFEEVKNVSIGSSSPRALKSYIMDVANFCDFDTNLIKLGGVEYNDVSLSLSDFEPNLNDFNFKYLNSFESIVKKMQHHFTTHKKWS